MMGLIILGILCCQSEAVVNELLSVMESKSQQVWGFSSLHCFSNPHRIHRAGKWVVNRCSGKLDHLQSVYKHFLLAPCQFWHPPHFEKTCGYVPSPCPLGSFWWDWCWRQWRFCRNFVLPITPFMRRNVTCTAWPGEQRRPLALLSARYRPNLKAFWIKEMINGLFKIQSPAVTGYIYPLLTCFAATCRKFWVSQSRGPLRCQTRRIWIIFLGWDKQWYISSCGPKHEEDMTSWSGSEEGHGDDQKTGASPLWG